MIKYFRLLVVLLAVRPEAIHAQPKPIHNLVFDSLATRWDEAIPLGNGLLGTLIWQKDNQLRFSLDRADLWDQRPMKGLHRPEFSYQWVFGQVVQQDYAPVQRYFDHPYDREPAPTKIPGGALEFATDAMGNVESVQLDLLSAQCDVRWSAGARLKTFVHANLPVGYFRFENVNAGFIPVLKAPRYQGATTNSGDPVGGDDLSRLGYAPGVITAGENSILYEQEGWGGFHYRISVKWRRAGKRTLEGVWTIDTMRKDSGLGKNQHLVDSLLKIGYSKGFASHLIWWKNFWSKSSIAIPDPVIEKQWWLEQYKFGSAARENTPPISLQAVWTADNGRIPPWKGDYHHDLNTQLSYWPAYTANHLDEALGYLNHLDENKANYRRYTKLYFGVDGLAVPGVTTLDGTEMGGWIQYSLSPTVSAWLAHHYYLQWKYSMDVEFLRRRAYPWVKEVAGFVEKITVLNAEGERQLPISSSPEINDNSMAAWFRQTTNYDLALMKFVVQAAQEMSLELGKSEPSFNTEADHWGALLKSFPGFALSESKSLKVSRDLSYAKSHRHFSHLMSIQPLGLIKWEDGLEAQETIRQTIADLDRVGPSQWCGYSYSWLANLKAWAKDGVGAAAALKTFATAFCSVNSFHLNGDQSGKGYSSFTYRPFTLEGNFAFASGLQEMLLQSHAGYIELLPAVPSDWETLSFKNFRTRGAFLVDADQQNGRLQRVMIRSEKGGETSIKLVGGDWKIKSRKGCNIQWSSSGVLHLRTAPGDWVELVN